MRRKVKVSKNVIPGVFTLFNMFFGFLAIVTAAQGFLQKASWLIFFAAIFDSIDGKVARKFNIPSKFGVEFDSAADLVSFCAAPSVLIYFAYVKELHPVLAAAISFIPLIFGAIRLARFNVQTLEKPIPYFVGLTTPLNALIIASFILFNEKIINSSGDPRIALPLIFLTSFLMLSHVRYSKVPNFKRGKWGKIQLILVLTGMGLLYIWQGLILFPIVMLYVLWGLIGWLIHHGELDIELEVESVRKFKRH